MSLSKAKFIEGLSQVGLLAPVEIETLKAASADKLAEDADALARELVEQGKLSRFQAAAVYQGRAEALVLGNYLVLDKLGAGGMGQVFRARHRRMDRVVALKVLPKKLLGSPDAIARFQREVKAAARLTHPHIVTAYDADEAAGMLYLVMEYVDGQDLAAIVKAHGPMSVAQAMDCVVQAARGLEHAHAQGIIHRDVKPSNLLLDKQGTVKILDMGLARFDNPLADGGSDDGLTAAGSVMGTVDFMSPEQALDTKHADARSDIYSLGCTLYYLLTGKKPYDADTSMKKLVAHREAPIPPLTAARPDVPPGLEAVYRKLVAKRPEQRYATMREAREALELAKAGRAAAPIAVAPAPVAASATPADLPTGSPRSSKKKAAAARSKAPLIAAGVAIALLLGIGGWLVPGMLSKQHVGDADAPAAIANTPVASRERQRPEAVAPSKTAVAPATAAPPIATPAPTKPPAIAATTALTPAASPSPPNLPFNPAIERKAAEWALGLGGKVEISLDGKLVELSRDAALPTRPFSVSAVMLPNLQQVTDDSLANLDGLSHLDHLNLTATGITDRSLEKLAGMKSLTKLEIRAPSITRAAYEKLREALPDCQIDWSPATLPTVAAAPAAPVVAKKAEDQPANTGESAAADTKLPIPDEDAQGAALKLLKDVYKDDYVQARQPEAKSALAEKLLKESQNSKDDPAVVYTMLREARDLAVEAANPALVQRIISIVTARYGGEPLKELASALGEMAGKPHPAEANRAIVEVALLQAAEAESATDFETAKRFADVALVAARKAKDSGLSKRAVELAKGIGNAKQQWDASRKARAVLAETPDDPAANLVVGRYLCLVQGDWEQGLPYLAKGPDGPLTELAAKSQTPSDSAMALVSLGDQWWDEAGKQKGKDSSLMRSGAQYWYSQALAGLTGLARTRVEQRLAEGGDKSKSTLHAVRKRLATPGATPVDLLKLINLQRDVVNGTNWKLENGKLIAAARPVTGQSPRLMLPITPPPEYALHLGVTPKPNCGLFVGLVVGGVQCGVYFDPGFTGLGMLDGLFPSRNPTTSKTIWDGEKPVDILCEVQPGGVLIKANGQLVFTWSGDPRRLSLNGGWTVPNPQALIIGQQRPIPLEITRLELGPIGMDPSAEGRKSPPGR